MHSNPFVVPERFQKPIGYRADGRPIYLMGGGSIQSFEPDPPAPVTLNTPPASPVVPPTSTGTNVFTAEDLERVRREEKDKLYGRLEEERASRQALEQQVQSLLTAQQEREKAEAEAREKAEREARERAEAEMDAKTLLQQRQQEWEERQRQQAEEWEQKFQQMNAEREQERLVLEKERQFATLTAYTQRRLAEEAESIAPQLRDFVNGNSPEEIEASIERVKAKTAEIAAEVQQTLVQQRSMQRGVAPTGYAPLGPLEIADDKREYTNEEIAKMPMSQWAELRKKIGIGGGDSNRGLYS